MKSGLYFRLSVNVRFQFSNSLTIYAFVKALFSANLLCPRLKVFVYLAEERRLGVTPLMFIPVSTSFIALRDCFRCLFAYIYYLPWKVRHFAVRSRLTVGILSYLLRLLTFQPYFWYDFQVVERSTCFERPSVSWRSRMFSSFILQLLEQPRKMCLKLYYIIR